jgi:peptidoglycan/xylan/chitin deacetylase (PgdA/CDA1 family)
MMRRTLKSLLRNVTLYPGIRGVFRPLLRDRATILMLHRFRNPDLGIEGHDPAFVRLALARLRRERYELVSLDDLFGRLRDGGRPLRGAVAFTIDDGYREHATIAADVFAEFDCPVTTFVTSGFLDGRLWFWWDRIEYVLRHATRRRVTLTVDGKPIVYEWQDEPSRRRAQLGCTELCKKLDDTAKRTVIENLAREAGVDLPAAPPPEYAPMSWDDVRRCEQRGMSFGPHTVTHPILARTSDRQAREELADSWTRLRAEASRPVAVFCYPNGQPGDFGPREITILRELGFRGAVTGVPGYASASQVAAVPEGPFTVPRFSWPDEMATLMQYVSGVERFKDIVRGR